jgi:hypothetical protein
VDASAVAAAWSAVLDLENVGEDDDFFFSLGGNSLLAAAVISTMAQQSGLPLELQDLYLAPTPLEFAGHLNHLENRMAQLAAQVPENADWDLPVFVTALAELGSAAADTFLPAESTLVYHGGVGAQPSPVPSRLSLLRSIRGRGTCSAEPGEGSEYLIRRDCSTFRVTAESTSKAVTVHVHEI